MENSNDFNYELQIAKFLADELNESECSNLLQWVNASEANLRLFSEMKLAWSLSKESGQMDEKEINNEYHEFLRRRKVSIEKPEIAGKTARSGNIGFYLVRIAALFLIIYSLGLSFLLFNEKLVPEYNTISTRKGEKSQLTLSDGTKIWINSESVLKYPVHIRESKVKLQLEGEAYFEVAKIKDREFIVSTSDLDISVLGTSFNVKSYKNEKTIETTLEEGQISITGKIGKEKLKDPLILLPNQRIIIAKSAEKPDNSITIMKTTENEKTAADSIITGAKPDVLMQEQTETLLYTSWKDGRLQFHKEKFEDLAVLLERWYDVEIEITQPDIKEWRFTGSFEKETIEQALTALSLSMSFHFTIDKNHIRIEH